MPTRQAAKKQKKGLQPRMFSGLNQKRMAQKSGGGGNRVQFGDETPTNTLQFLDTPEEMREYYIHAFQEDGRWHFVPCAGQDECPLCDSESERVRQISYRFACNVLDLKTGQVKILEGPKTLASLIFYKYKRKPAVFLKRVFDVTRFPTRPVTFNFELAEEDAVSTRGKKKIDLDEYVLGEMKSYYGDDLTLTPADLSDDSDDEDDEDDDELDEDEFTESILKKKSVGDLKELAEELEVDPVPKTKPKLIAAILAAQDADEDEDDEDEDEEDDEDLDDEDDDEEDDEDEDDDEDEEDEDEEPPARRRKVPVKATSKKVPARKAAAKSTRRK